MNDSTLQPHPHVPPVGWSAETFERVTAALAAALVAAYNKRQIAEERAAECSP